jgi:uncharacterized damage-inducible protein DinB
MADARVDLIALSDYVYERTRSRLDGLTDTEYLWEPVPGCWTIRRAASGKYQADHSDSPGLPPFTTIAWRLWHLVECYAGVRNPQWLGLSRQPAGFERDDPAPASAAEAVSVLERAHAFWQGLIQDLSADSLREPLGPVAGSYAEDDKASLVLHQLDEQIHHGAELGVLRDLYQHSRTPDKTAKVPSPNESGHAP